MKKEIPNIITLCNLLCGVLSTYYAIVGDIFVAALLILAGIVFDFCDGLAARKFNVASPLGKELDSMADLVTSGVAPGFILYTILAGNHVCENLKFVALLVPLFAAYRLAKFNLDTRQTYSFLGLPAPSNAIIWASLGAYMGNGQVANLALIKQGWIIPFCESPLGVCLTVVVALSGCWLMVSEVPLFALKFKNLQWAENKLRFIFLAVSALLLVLFGVIALPAVILWYILLSLCAQKQMR